MVTGTTGDDDITLSGQSGSVTVDLLAGDDILHASSLWSSVDATATIHGNSGDDTLDFTGFFFSATGSGSTGQVVTLHNGVTLTHNWDGIERLWIDGYDVSTAHSFVTGDSDDALDLRSTQNDQAVDIATHGGDDSVILRDDYRSGTIDAGAGDDVVDLHFVDGNGGVANAFDILGGAGDDSLTGSLGDDSLYGGADDDSYYIRSGQSDTVVELAGEGIDAVYTDRNYTLPDHVENLFFFDFSIFGPDFYPSSFTGNALDNHIVGTGGTTIDGGAGADTMEMGSVYYVDNVGDVVIEGPGGFNEDTVFSSVTYTIGDNIENLRLTGGDAIDGTGNGLDNDLFGNAAANTLTGGAGRDLLDGGLGVDTLVGGADEDRYELHDGDVVVELAGGGYDTVASWIASYTLTDNVEVLILKAGALNGTGNALGNEIRVDTGLSANANFIDGGGGADTMEGRNGDDIYVVDNPLDHVIEQSTGFFPTAGYDTVLSSATYTLAPNVEKLVLTGSGDIGGTGNNLNNLIEGNGGDNVLDGLYGNDTMRGGSGNDTYYVSHPGDITEESAGSGTDTVYSATHWNSGPPFRKPRPARQRQPRRDRQRRSQPAHRQ